MRIGAKAQGRGMMGGERGTPQQRTAKVELCASAQQRAQRIKDLSKQIRKMGRTGFCYSKS